MERKKEESGDERQGEKEGLYIKKRSTMMGKHD